MTEAIDDQKTDGSSADPRGEPIGALLLPMGVWDDKSAFDLETCQYLKTAPELGLFPPPGPRAPEDAIEFPFVVIPTAHWNALQAFIDGAGVRDGWNAVGAVLSRIHRRSIGYEDYSVPERVAATRRWLHSMQGVAEDEYMNILAEAVLGPGATIEDYRAFVAKAVAGTQKKEPSNG